MLNPSYRNIETTYYFCFFTTQQKVMKQTIFHILPCLAFFLSSLLPSPINAQQSGVFWADQQLGYIFYLDLNMNNTYLFPYNQQVVRRIRHSSILNKVYWVEGGTGTIHRSNIDGSELENILTTNSNNLGLIELDHNNNRIFYTITNDNYIRTANFDGTNQQILVNNVGTVQGITYDPTNDKIYWTEFFSGQIKKANGDGTNVSTIFRSTGHPFDIEIDSTHQYLYFSDRLFNKIFRLNTNGDSLTTITGGGGIPGAISLDLINNEIYWIDSELQLINKTDITGSGLINTLFFGNGSLSGMDILLTPPKPTPTQSPTNPTINLSLFPIPTYEQINISFSSPYIGELSLFVYHVNGKLMLHKKLDKPSTEWTYTIPLHSYPSGTYFLQINTDNQQTSKRFIHIKEIHTP